MRETNRYTREKLACQALDKWQDVTLIEIKAFLGVCVVMGVNPLPCTAVCQHHWLHKQFRRFQVSVLMVMLKMIAPSIFISLLFTACMCIVTGIRPSSYRPRHLITLTDASQAGISNSRDSYCIRLWGDRPVSKCPVVFWMGCSCECEEWLRLR